MVKVQIQVNQNAAPVECIEQTDIDMLRRIERLIANSMPNESIRVGGLAAKLGRIRKMGPK